MYGVTHLFPNLGAAGGQTPKKYGLVAGTYIGTAGATAAIIPTGCRKVHNVWANLCLEARSAATTGGVHGVRACRAAGTPGSFYLYAFRIVAGATVSNFCGLAAGATFKWLALVDDE